MLTAKQHSEMVGQRFSNLVILSAQRIKGRHATATCQCDCGTIKTIRLDHILSGAQKGCGCGRAHTLKHGKSGTKIYALWWGMISRCKNPNHKHFALYGGRGIKVCERWKTFENFYADMGERPAGMSLERVNSNGDYEPGNVQWATQTVQMNNTSRNRRVLYRGAEMTVAQAMRLAGYTGSGRTVYLRVKRGFDVETAMQHKGALR